MAKILVIDEDGEFYPFAKEVLEESGFELFRSSQIDHVFTDIDQVWPDLIIQNIHPNNVDQQLKLSEELHHDPILRFLPILHIREDNQNNTNIEENPHFISACLYKPYSSNELVKTVREIVELRK